ncbi:hypothetical protein BDZ89DRAFT_1048163 [Hymenopellis radicata]|nr:hypothetical protein BDZ89DRAFT_1048163 [Hymenopellis radicata]
MDKQDSGALGLLFRDALGQWGASKKEQRRTQVTKWTAFFIIILVLKRVEYVVAGALSQDHTPRRPSYPDDLLLRGILRAQQRASWGHIGLWHLQRNSTITLTSARAR